MLASKFCSINIHMHIHIHIHAWTFTKLSKQKGLQVGLKEPYSSAITMDWVREVREREREIFEQPGSNSQQRQELVG